MNKKVVKHKIFKREILEEIFPKESMEILDRTYSKIKLISLIKKFDTTNKK
jgi:hypothetical protein